MPKYYWKLVVLRSQLLAFYSVTCDRDNLSTSVPYTLTVGKGFGLGIVADNVFDIGREVTCDRALASSTHVHDAVTLT